MPAPRERFFVNDVSIEIPEKKLVSYGEGIFLRTLCVSGRTNIWIDAKKGYAYCSQYRPDAFDAVDKRPAIIQARWWRSRCETRNDYYGTLWVSYESPHYFTDETDSIFKYNYRGKPLLRRSMHVCLRHPMWDRQRLQAVLDSTPEPVLVFDQKKSIAVD